MDEIYFLVGQVIETFQYIEHNLALIIWYDEILRPFNSRNNIPAKEFYEIEITIGELKESIKENGLDYTALCGSNIKLSGWGGWIWTTACQSQSLMPYRLATPQ